MQVRRVKAATKVQATWRMHHQRRVFRRHRQEKAATVIQSYTRMAQQRSRFRSGLASSAASVKTLFSGAFGSWSAVLAVCCASGAPHLLHFQAADRAWQTPGCKSSSGAATGHRCDHHPEACAGKSGDKEGEL